MRFRIVLLAAAVLLLSILPVAADDIPVDQASLGSGAVYEINADAAGQKLYISHWGAGKIWRIDDKTTGAYTRFEGLGAPNDARPDKDGDIWFTDSNQPYLRRINVNANPVTVTTWDLSAWDPARTFSLRGLAIQAKAGARDWVWFSEYDNSETIDTQLLYRFNPDTNKLCGYLLPNGNHSSYILNYDGNLWLGDRVKNRIYQVNPGNLAYTYWAATAVGEPLGLAADAKGLIWWADTALNSSRLMRLEPAGSDPNRLTVFALPVAGTPYMLAPRDRKMWYTSEGVEASNVGFVDVDSVPGVPIKHKPTPVTGTAGPVNCDQGVLTGVDTPVTVSTPGSRLAWRSETWTDVTPIDKPDWTVYETVRGGVLYGIRAETNLLWVTDQLYQQLVRVVLGLAAPQISILPTSASDAAVTWNPVSGASECRGWVGAEPYFPVSGSGVVVTSPWPQPGVLNTAANSYYVVRAAAGTNVSLESNRVGKFAFSLTKGQ